MKLKKSNKPTSEAYTQRNNDCGDYAELMVEKYFNLQKASKHEDNKGIDFKSESRNQTFQVKFDGGGSGGPLKTKNLYIETEHRDQSIGPWHSSHFGKSDLYINVCPQNIENIFNERGSFFITKTSELQKSIKESKATPVKSPTSKGWLIPLHSVKYREVSFPKFNNNNIEKEKPKSKKYHGFGL